MQSIYETEKTDQHSIRLRARSTEPVPQFAPVRIAGATADISNNAWIAVSLSVTNPVNFVSFDMEFTSASGAEGLLTVYWNTNIIGSVDERLADTVVKSHTFGLPNRETGGQHVLSFRLDAFTNITSSVLITNVTLTYVGVTDPLELSVVSTDTNGLTTFRCTGAPGYNYVVEASTNLLDWEATILLVNTNGVVDFYDSAQTNTSQRFYRVAGP